MDTEALLDELEHGPLQIEQMSFDSLVDSSEDAPFVSHHAQAPGARNGHRHAPPQTQAAVTGRHQDTRLFMAVMLKTFVEMIDAGLVRDAPFQVHLGTGKQYEPDITFVANSNFDRVHDTYIEGPADLIVEVLSEETTARDRGEKFVAYEAAGVREYWLLDPLRELVDLYVLEADGWFTEYRSDTAGRMRSRVLKGFMLDTNLLWKKILPTTVESVEMVQVMVSQR
ncbi:MAG: Uma2 family endonuclease [Anaerolineae bacterium]|nr:Uma2 family endonuclease [Anaerolineae bacterium]